MGGAKTKTVGGAPTTALGKDYTSFLNSAVNGQGNFQDATSALMSGGSGASNLNNFLSNLHTGVPNVSGVSSAGSGLGNLASLFNTNYNSPTSTGVNQPNYSNLFNTNISAPSNNLNALQQAGINPVQGPAAFNPNTTPVTNFQDPNVAALTSMANNQMNQGVSDLRERYSSMGGGAANGTPAGYAEAIYRANAAPQLTNALSQFSQAESGLNLQNNANNNSALANNQSLAAQVGLGNNQLSASSLMQLLGNNLNSQLSTNQLNSNNSGMLGQLLQGQTGQVQQNSQFNANQQQGTNALNSNNIQSLVQSLLSQGQLGQQNNQFNASQNQQANLANQNAAQQGVSNQLNIGQLMNSGNANQNQAMMSILNQMFGGLNQSTALGTPQAQTVQTPSGFSQVMGGLGSIAGMVAPLAMAGINPLSLLGLGGNIPKLPAWNTLSQLGRTAGNG